MSCKLPLLLLFLLLSSCATTPMPIATVPKVGNALSSEFSAGNKGIGFNTIYTTKRKTVLNLCLQTKPWPGLSNVYDLGLGQVIKGRFLLMGTFGYGRHRVEHFRLGQSGVRLTTFVDAFRASIYLNGELFKNVYFVVRPSMFWGDAAHTTSGYPPSRRTNFITYALEPALFHRFGTHEKKENVLLGLGGYFPFIGLNYFSDDDSDFVPAIFWISCGYRFGKG